MKIIKKILAFFNILVICGCFLSVINANAEESASVLISSANGVVGEKINITVTINASEDIGGAFIYVSYDNTIIKPTSGSNSGVIRYEFTDGKSYGMNESLTQEFEIIGVGTTTLSVTGDSRIVSINNERESISSSSSGKVTAKAPASYSSDNTLKSLQISPGTLSPAFSPDRTTYNATVDADVTELVVSAAANDSAAKISISGRRMDPGSNTTTITVTAEDGSVKKYIIYTTKLVDGQEATTEAESRQKLLQKMHHRRLIMMEL